MVSIIIPCYNLTEYLTESINSIIEQTYQNWQIIVVNDGSTDDSWNSICRIIKTYKDKKIILINQLNMGLSEARNIGIKHAEGNYILCLDPDDKLLPTCLEKMTNILHSYPEISIVGVWQQRFGDQLGVIQTAPNFDNVFWDPNFNYCSMYKKSVWQSINGYDTKITAAEDWDFWMSCKEKGFELSTIQEPLFCYRIRENSKLKKDQSDQNILYQTYTLLKSKHPHYNDVLGWQIPPVSVATTSIASDFNYGPLMQYIEQHDKFVGEAISKWLYDLKTPQSIVDIGCGPGIYISPLQNKCEVLGVDSCPSGGKMLTNNNFILTDIRNFHPQKKYDMVICIEVAEHIHTDQSDNLVNLLCECSDFIVFSAAPPGQGGDNHINCQPFEFWYKKFRSHNFFIDFTTNEFKNFLWSNPTIQQAPWLRDNLVLLSKSV